MTISDLKFSAKKVGDLLLRQAPLLAFVLLAIAVFVSAYPEQGYVLNKKLATVGLFAFVGYYIDLAIGSYARPHRLLEKYYSVAKEERMPAAIVFAASALRRALIVASSMLAGALAL